MPNEFAQLFVAGVQANIAELAASTARGDEKPDYIKDGLIFCGECNTAKQFRTVNPEVVEAFGTDILPCMCECQKKEQSKMDAFMERNQKENAEKQRLEDAIRRGDIANKGYLYYTFERDKTPDSDISRKARKYADNFSDMYQKNIGLMFYGDNDAAKTFYACCIANAVFKAGYSVLVDTYGNLCSLVQDFGKRDSVLYAVRNYHLVVFDEYGAERGTEYVQDGAYSLINERIVSKKPMIITTNMRPGIVTPDMSEQTKRIISRLDEAVTPLEVPSSGVREKKGEAKSKYLERLWNE